MQWNDLIVEVFRLDLAAKLFGAVLIGGGIGLEREYKGKPAGLRTNILICVGSALLMDLSLSMAERHGGDPGRIAAQVVTGIGFLGAGTILHTRGMITGLTSAATIWVVAAIGLTIGAGYFLEALGATLTVMLVLVGLGWVERRFLDFDGNGHGVPDSEWSARSRRDSEGSARSRRDSEGSTRSRRDSEERPVVQEHEERQHRPVHPDDADRK